MNDLTEDEMEVILSSLRTAREAVRQNDGELGAWELNSVYDKIALNLSERIDEAIHEL